MVLSGGNSGESRRADRLSRCRYPFRNDLTGRSQPQRVTWRLACGIVGIQPEAGVSACLIRSACTGFYPVFGSYKTYASLRPDKCAMKRTCGETHRGRRGYKVLINIRLITSDTAWNIERKQSLLSVIRPTARFTYSRCPYNHCWAERSSILSASIRPDVRIYPGNWEFGFFKGADNSQAARESALPPEVVSNA